jgi:ABC-type phosphate transport system auxiliary subunit
MDDNEQPLSDPERQLESSDEEPSELDELERSLQETEELLSHVKQRLTQVRSAHQRQVQLQTRLSELDADPNLVREPAISAELESIKTQLSATWEELESQLITWRDKQELFWQFLRFSGIGFFLALALNYLAHR